MSIIGNTIDYGPYGWLENYDPTWTPNTTDNQHKRYQFGQQGNIALWNLYKLANAIYPLVEDAKPFEEILQAFPKQYNDAYLIMMKQKLGLEIEHENDFKLIEELESILQIVETDMTIFFRNLSLFSIHFSVDENFKLIQSAFYLDDYLDAEIYNQWKSWIEKYVNRLRLETKKDADKKSSMNLVNPKYVLRNYMAQLAIDAANEGNYHLINELHELLKKPYKEQPENEKWFAKRPDWARHKVGCSMLSCSS
jgi:serine/tyrosine/threonine adenylyltransferase